MDEENLHPATAQNRRVHDDSHIWNNHSIFLVVATGYFYPFDSTGFIYSSASLGLTKVCLVSAKATKKIAIFRPILIVNIILRNVHDT
jgi:hypothetical protein